jgi:protein-S-isoprenylcysteine O-methyltransferase Ste14
VVVKIGGLALTGLPAALLLLAFLAAIVGSIVLLRPAFGWSPLWISAALWIAFIGYWSAAAKDASAAKSAEPSSSRQLHQNLLNVALLLLFLRVPGLKARWVPASIYLVVAGLALHVAFALLAVWARRHLGRNWSGAITEKVDHELVRSGPYRFLRHPIYSAMLGMYLGTAVVSGEVHALIAVAIVVAAYWRKLRLEKRHLREVFGAAYDDYRGASWALIPGLF